MTNIYDYGINSILGFAVLIKIYYHLKRGLQLYNCLILIKIYLSNAPFQILH